MEKISIQVLALLFTLMATSAVQADCQFQNERVWQGSDDTYKVAEVVSTCELLPNIWAQELATIVWYSNGQVQRISRIGKDSTVAPGIVVQPAAYVGWFRNGHLSYVQLLKNNTEVAPGVWARHTGSFVTWHENGKVRWVEVLIKDIPGAKKCQQVAFNQDGTVNIAADSYMWPSCY